MHETNITLITISNSLENGSFDSTTFEQNEKVEMKLI
jgi:hypothetical protein